MAAPTTNLDRTLTVTLANPTPPTNSVVTYQGTPPTPQGLAPSQVSALLNPALFALPMNSATPPELSGMAEANGTEVMVTDPTGRVTCHSVLGKYSEAPNARHPSCHPPPLGEELVGYGMFGRAAGWTLTGGATIGGGTLNLDGTGEGKAARVPVSPITSGPYQYEFDVISTAGDTTCFVIVGGSLIVSVTGSDAPGHFIGSVTSAANEQIVALGSSNNVCVLDNFSVRRKI